MDIIVPTLVPFCVLRSSINPPPHISHCRQSHKQKHIHITTLCGVTVHIVTGSVPFLLNTHTTRSLLLRLIIINIIISFFFSLIEENKNTHTPLVPHIMLCSMIRLVTTVSVVAGVMMMMMMMMPPSNTFHYRCVVTAFSSAIRTTALGGRRAQQQQLSSIRPIMKGLDSTTTIHRHNKQTSTVGLSGPNLGPWPSRYRKVDTSSSRRMMLSMSATSSSSIETAVTNTDNIIPRLKAADATKPTDGNPVLVKGWVRTVRKQKTLAFVEVNDGSNLGGIQCVLSFDTIDDTSKDELSKVTTGCAVVVEGPVVASQGGKQAVEVAATKLRVVGECPGEQYPLAKKRHTLEYLRTIAHLRPRTNTIAAVSRVRSHLAGAIHAFFQQSGFVYVQTPIITASDCEGAGELFRVTTLPMEKSTSLPLVKSEDGKGTTDDVDSSQDFFGKPAYLTVSGQLNGESYASALGDIYTFGPTFRAENSQTTRHLAEFHMVEPEMAFADLGSTMDNAEQMLKFVVKHVLENCKEDLGFFNQFYDKGLLSRLEKLVSQPFVRVSYRDAIGYLQEEISKDPSKWQFPTVEFGTDLATEHERWLAETKFESAVFVYNYPKKIKAFYMRDNDEDGGETVNAMDLLVPGVGEMVGGSQREERLDVLLEKMKEVNLDPKDYWWYLDLRRYGSVPHSGYGLGFERLVTYVCGIDNIREAIAFPRYPGHAEF